MARTNRANLLDNRTARLKLPLKKRFYAGIGQGLALCYRRNSKGVGTWTARIGTHTYKNRLIGEADDFKDADGQTVFSYFQAAEKARGCEKEHKIGLGLIEQPLTVSKATDDYLSWFKLNRKSYKSVLATINAHILPKFGDCLISELTTLQIKRWHEDLALLPRRKRTSAFEMRRDVLPPPQTDEEKRARKATANRILTVFKAILNKAFYDGKVSNDTAWRRVKPFAKVEQPRIRFLKPYETEFLLNVCPPDFKALVRAALFTGARYGELTKLRCADFLTDQQMIYIQPSKSGKARYVPLSPEGFHFFKSVTTGKTGGELIFMRENGKPWQKNDQQRPMKEACLKAHIEPAIGFHELRHTYASMLAQRGVDLLTISKLLGHADTRITSRHYAHLCDETLRAAVARLPFAFDEETKVVGIK